MLGAKSLPFLLWAFQLVSLYTSLGAASNDMECVSDDLAEFIDELYSGQFKHLGTSLPEEEQRSAPPLINTISSLSLPNPNSVVQLNLETQKMSAAASQTLKPQNPVVRSGAILLKDDDNMLLYPSYIGCRKCLQCMDIDSFPSHLKWSHKDMLADPEMCLKVYALQLPFGYASYSQQPTGKYFCIYCGLFIPNDARAAHVKSYHFSAFEELPVEERDAYNLAVAERERKQLGISTACSSNYTLSHQPPVHFFKEEAAPKKVRKAPSSAKPRKIKAKLNPTLSSSTSTLTTDSGNAAWPRQTALPVHPENYAMLVAEDSLSNTSKDGQSHQSPNKRSRLNEYKDFMA